jgi:hypothetical protein
MKSVKPSCRKWKKNYLQTQILYHQKKNKSHFKKQIMRRGSLLLTGIASALATIITLNVTLGRSWNYYGSYGYGHRRHYCDNRHRRDTDKSNQLNHDNRGPDSATGKY